MRRLLAITITLLALSATLLAGHGGGHGRGHLRGHGRGNARANGWHGRRAPAVVVAPGLYGPAYSGGHGGYVLPQRDLVVVGQYYRNAYSQGLNLPPGLAKKYARGGALPPGWQRKMRPLPGAYQRRLGPLPGAYRRGLLNGIYVVYDPVRGLIIDATTAIGF